MEDIAKANQISNIHKLNIGDLLLIPTSKDKVDVVLQELLRRRAKAEEEAKRAPKIETYTYVVQDGDSLWSIANKVNLDINTLFGCNDLKNPDVLKPGTELRIPNQDGIFYKVAKGDTLKKIADKYGIYVEAIMTANSIDSDTALIAGSEIFLPGAKEIVSSSSASSGRKDLHTGLDIGAPRGTRIAAAASGVVVYTGWMGGYGQTVVIDHGRGYKTLYGHCSKILVKQGQRVSSGQVIAAVGATGRATGSHLHFEIRVNNVPVNPLKHLR
jgi:murein DD-endopeptidase MepM/ murein hydrolase activator NlpD